MDLNQIFVVLGPVVAILVQFAKKIPVVASYPKLFAGAFSLAIAASAYFLHGDLGTGVTSLLQVVVDALTATSTAVLTYEAVRNR